MIDSCLLSLRLSQFLFQKWTHDISSGLSSRLLHNLADQRLYSVHFTTAIIIGGLRIIGNDFLDDMLQGTLVANGWFDAFPGHNGCGQFSSGEGFIEHLFSLLTRDALLIEQIEQVRHGSGSERAILRGSTVSLEQTHDLAEHPVTGDPGARLAIFDIGGIHNV